LWGKNSNKRQKNWLVEQGYYTNMTSENCQDGEWFSTAIVWLRLEWNGHLHNICSCFSLLPLDERARNQVKRKLFAAKKGEHAGSTM